MTLESTSTIVSMPIKEVFGKLTKANTYERLLPQEANFESKDEKQFSFKLSGMPVIALKIERETLHNEVVLVADGGNIPFELIVMLTEINTQTKIQVKFEGALNTMMQMMVKKPLAQLLETLIGNAEKL
ncbi:MAG: hypothetical protein P8H25_04890 [Flavobacteriaceae bacterium]|nr:hypothetical protein [Flavobacteriaceae bacterium]